MNISSPDKTMKAILLNHPTPQVIELHDYIKRLESSNRLLKYLLMNRRDPALEYKCAYKFLSEE